MHGVNDTDIQQAIQEGFRNLSKDMRNFRNVAVNSSREMVADISSGTTYGQRGMQLAQRDFSVVDNTLYGASVGVNAAIERSGLWNSIESNKFRTSRSLIQDIAAINGREYADVNSFDAKRLAQEGLSYRWTVAKNWMPGRRHKITDAKTEYAHRAIMEISGRYNVTADISSSERGFGYSQGEKSEVSKHVGSNLRRSPFIKWGSGFERGELESMMGILNDVGAFKQFRATSATENIRIITDLMGNIQSAMKILYMTNDDATAMVGDLKYRQMDDDERHQTISLLNRASAKVGLSPDQLHQYAKSEADAVFAGGGKWKGAYKSLVRRVISIAGGETRNVIGTDHELRDRGLEMSANYLPALVSFGDDGTLQANRDVIDKLSMGGLTVPELAKLTTQGLGEMTKEQRLRIRGIDSPEKVNALFSHLGVDNAGEIGAWVKTMIAHQKWAVFDDDASLGDFIAHHNFKILAGLDDDEIEAMTQSLEKVRGDDRFAKEKLDANERLKRERNSELFRNVKSTPKISRSEENLSTTEGLFMLLSSVAGVAHEQSDHFPGSAAISKLYKYYYTNMDKSKNSDEILESIYTQFENEYVDALPGVATKEEIRRRFDSIATEIEKAPGRSRSTYSAIKPHWNNQLHFGFIDSWRKQKKMFDAIPNMDDAKRSFDSGGPERRLKEKVDDIERMTNEIIDALGQGTR